MLNVLSLLPIPILIFIFIIVSITLVTIRLRKVLYDLIIRLKTDLSFTKKIKNSYESASKQLERVNTPVLVDRIYSNERIDFFGKKLKIEQWDYFCRMLPNLLIAFGLLGTFLGITQNLASISGILNMSQSTDTIAIEDLRDPLKSMGIAFSSSLIALLCSSIITIVNFIWNINLAKSELLSALEDYLDNVYQPEITGHTRLDKAVERMSKIQENFLERFHEKVGIVLENTLSPVANKIADENIKLSEKLIYLGESFTGSAGTIKNSSGEFNKAAEELIGFVSRIELAIQHENFREYARILDNSVSQFKEASETIRDSKFSENLDKFTKLAFEIEALGDDVKGLNQQSRQFLTTNQKNIKLLLDLFEQNQNQLNITVDKMSANIENSLDKNYSLSLSSLNNFDKKVDILVNTLADKTNAINSMITDALRRIYQYHQAIFDSLQEIQALQSQENDEIKSSNAQASKVVETLKSNSENIVFTIDNLKEMINSLKLVEQEQSEKMLATISNKIQVHQDTLKESLKIIADDNKTNKNDILNAYSDFSNLIDMKNLLGNLDEIKSGITQIITIIEQDSSKRMSEKSEFKLTVEQEDE
jgi:hypothetical protein